MMCAECSNICSMSWLRREILTSFVLLNLSQERFARNTIRELEDVDVRELAIHHKVSRMNYSRRCAETLAVQAYQKRGLALDPGMEIGFVVADAAKVGGRS
jgi:hypothetical protein